MRMRSRWVLVVALLGACKGKAKDPQASPTPSTPIDAAVVAAAPDAAPDPCAVARQLVAGAERLRADGKIGRALRDAEAADRACPNLGRQASWELRAELDAEPDLTASALWDRARAHEAAGRIVDARRDYARSLERFEAETGNGVRPRIDASGSSVRAIRHAADGKTVLALARSGAVVTFEVATGRAMTSVDIGPLTVTETADIQGGLVVAGQHAGVALRDAAGAVRGVAPAYDVEAVLEVAAAPDGARVAVADGTRSLLVDVATGAVETLVKHDAMLGMAFSPDGTKLAGTTDDDQVVTVFDVATRKPLLRLEGHTDSLRPLAWSADGKRLASAGYDGTIRLWDAETGAAVAVIRASGDVFALAFRPDGQALAAGGRGGLQLFMLGSDAPPIDLAGRTDSAVSLSWAPDGSTLAAGLNDGNVAFYDANGAHLRSTGLGVSAPVGAWLAGSMLVWATRDGGLFTWNLAATGGPTFRSLGVELDSAALSPDGKTLAYTVTRGVVERIDLDGAPLPPLPAADGRVNILRFSPDGARLAGVANGRLYLWDLAAASVATPIDEKVRTSIAWSLDGQRVVAVTNDGAVTTDGTIASLDSAAIVAVGPKGTIFLTSILGDFVAFDSTGKELRRSEESDAPQAMAWSPDGMWFARASGAHVQIVDTAGTTQASIYTNDSRVGAIAWSADSKMLAIAGTDGAVEVGSVDGTRQVSLAATRGGHWVVVGRDRRVDGPSPPHFLRWHLREGRGASGRVFAATAAWDREHTPGLLQIALDDRARTP